MHRLDPATFATVSKISYFIAKENIALVKMKYLFEVIERQGASDGHGYRNDKTCATFVHYIAEDLELQLPSHLSKVKFQSYASTDFSNIDNELFLVLYFDPHTNDGKVYVRDKFLAIRQPYSSTGFGLF